MIAGFIAFAFFAVDIDGVAGGERCGGAKNIIDAEAFVFGEAGRAIIPPRVDGFIGVAVAEAIGEGEVVVGFLAVQGGVVAKGFYGFERKL